MGQQQSNKVPDPGDPEQGPQKAPSPEHEDHSPPKKPKQSQDPLEVIQLIVQDVEALAKDVDRFTETSRTAKDYIYLEEMLTRNLLKLDEIETEGREDVRQSRKDCIKLIQQTIAELEAKVPSEENTEEDTDIQTPSGGVTNTLDPSQFALENNTNNEEQEEVDVDT